MTRTSRIGDSPAGRDRRHVSGEQQVCADCRDRVEGNLVDLSELYEMCTFAVVLSGHGPGSTHPALAVQAETSRSLAWWCGVVASARGVTAPEGTRVRGLTSFLAIHLDWLLAHPAAPEFAGALDQLTATIRDTLRPPDHHRSSSRNEK